jgi:hypothetical protein
MRVRGMTAAVTAALLTAVPVLFQGSGASAAPVTREAFYAALTSAISQSGPLVPGTTLRFTQVEVAGPGARPVTRKDVVNPDGSLTLRRAVAGRVREVRCSAIDRCWERVIDSRSDRRWHRLLPGAVTLTTIVPDFVTPTSDLWPIDATFDDTTTSGGMRRLTARYTSNGGTTLDRYIVEAHRVTRDLSRVDANDEVIGSIAVSFESQPLPVKVTAPRARTIGRPFTPSRTPGPSYVGRFEAYANIPS